MTRSARKALDLEADVDMGVIRECLQIGLQAPNGSNQQSWRWILVSDPALRANIADLYRQAYLELVGGRLIADLMPLGEPQTRLMSSTEWLVQHLAEVPVLVVPCYRPYTRRTPGDEFFYQATIYGSVFPAVWNFHLALRTRGYGTCITTLHLHRHQAIRELLGIPDAYLQCCLLPVARLRKGLKFKKANRLPVDDVIAVDRWPSE